MKNIVLIMKTQNISPGQITKSVENYDFWAHLD
jgi:hypothetical protein